jgi:hypothetical protein
MREVKRFAEYFKTKYERLDVLVHSTGTTNVITSNLNPGVLKTSKVLSDEGVENVYGVGYLKYSLLISEFTSTVVSC